MEQSFFFFFGSNGAVVGYLGFVKDKSWIWKVVQCPKTKWEPTSLGSEWLAIASLPSSKKKSKKERKGGRGQSQRVNHSVCCCDLWLCECHQKQSVGINLTERRRTSEGSDCVPHPHPRLRLSRFWISIGIFEMNWVSGIQFAVLVWSSSSSRSRWGCFRTRSRGSLAVPITVLYSFPPFHFYMWFHSFILGQTFVSYNLSFLFVCLCPITCIIRIWNVLYIDLIGEMLRFS